MTNTVDTDNKIRPPGHLGSEFTSRPSPPLWWAVIQLMALGFHLPLTVLTGAQSSMASPSSVLAIGSLVSLASLMLYLGLGRTMATKWRALAAASTSVIFFWHWDAGSIGGPVAAVILFGLVAAAAVKFSSSHYFKMAALVGSITLSATMGALVITDSLDKPPRVTGVQDPMSAVSLESRPDIVLLLLDGYGRADVMRDFYDFDNEPFLDDLRDHGFEVAQQSVANYSITHLSIPALLNMSYMHPGGAVIGNDDLAFLAGEIAGSNDLVEFLQGEGYSYVHGEGDHWVNRCGENVDVCLAGPPLDITGWAVLQRTPIGEFLYTETGDPTTHLNVTRIDDLMNWDEVTAQVTSPMFAFVHLQLPHPPLFLDASCDLRIDPLLDGRILNDGRIDEALVEERKLAWVEQVECANTTISTFVDSLPPDTVVVIASDHGPDAVFNFEPIAANLTEDQIYERFSTLTAVRLPSECEGSLPGNVDTVNTFRVVLSCLSNEDIPMLDTRSYLGGFGGPIQEVQLPADNADR